MACLIAPPLPANLIRSCSVVRHCWSLWTDKNQRSEKTERQRARETDNERGERERGEGLDKSFNAYASRLENDYLAVWLWRCVWRPDSSQRLRSLIRRKNWVYMWVCVCVKTVLLSTKSWHALYHLTAGRAANSQLLSYFNISSHFAVLHQTVVYRFLYIISCTSLPSAHSLK